MRENIHSIIMGPPGCGKSTLAAKFPKPMLVAMTDPPGKERPYLDRGTAGPIKADKEKGVYYREVFSKKEPEKLVIRIKFWGEANPHQPTAYSRFQSRFDAIEQEIVSVGWKSLIMDTSTYFELGARYYSEFSLNKDVLDGRQHYAFSTKACEQYIMMRWPNMLLANTVVLAHVDDQKEDANGEDGGVVVKKMVALPGKLPNRVLGGFGEVWRVYMDQSGNYRVQTMERPGNSYKCKTLMGFPDGLYPDLELMWKALEEKQEKANGLVQ